MNAVRRYLLPGFVFQSVVIAGGYGTGRELVEYFLSRGPLGGLLAMALSTLLFSLVCVVSFEFARVFGAFEYRSFFRRLLGRYWVAFEVLYMALMMIVLAVIGAAAGSIFEQTFGLHYLAGVLAIMTVVGLLVLGGNRSIERAFAGWSAVLYLVYAIFFVWCLASFSPEIRAALAGGEVEGSWIRSGLEYVGYNLGVLPAVLITIRHARSRRDTFVSGLLAGPIGMIPALLFFVSIAGQYPGIVEESFPANQMLARLGSPGFRVAFQIMLFGTLAETGAGLIHAVNERIARGYRDSNRELPSRTRVVAALAMLALGALIAQFGLIPLIGVGYRYISYGYLAVFVLPVLTWGLVLIRRERSAGAG